jgi:hypothetical protein
VTTFQNPFSIGISSNVKYNHMASDQLNVMTYGVATSIPNNVFWTQDVFSLNQTGKCPNTCFQITSEIFNETTPDAAINYVDTFTTNCVKNGGTPTKAVDTFYCDSKWQTGLTFPLTLKLMVVAGTETSGKYIDENYISFQYWLSNGPDAKKWIQFDRMDFNNLVSGKRIPGDPLFKVSGDPMATPPFSSTTRCGTGSSGSYSCPLLNDAENVLGGYAGGANVLFDNLNAKTQLLYWTGTKFDFVPHAFSAGADTGEATVNTYSLGSKAQFAGTVFGNDTLGSDDAIQLY